jgi:hypothetical protein
MGSMASQQSFPSIALFSPTSNLDLKNTFCLKLSSFLLFMSSLCFPFSALPLTSTRKGIESRWALGFSWVADSY